MKKIILFIMIFFSWASTSNAGDRDVIKSISNFFSYARNVDSVSSDDIDKLTTLFSDIKMEVNVREKEQDAKNGFIAKASECAILSLQTIKEFEMQRHSEFQGRKKTLTGKTSNNVRQGEKCLEELYRYM